jgi:hypothetical protein
MKHAIVKYNNGNGALLCNECHAIIAYGFDHVDTVHYCDKCVDGKLVKRKDGKVEKPDGFVKLDLAPLL